MTLDTILCWGALTLLFIDMALLCWLAFTITLYGDRRGRSGWIVTGAMFIGAIMLAANAYTISRGDISPQNQMVIPGLVLPYLWYLVVLLLTRAAGFSVLRSRGFWLASVTGLSLLALLLMDLFYPETGNHLLSALIGLFVSADTQDSLPTVSLFSGPILIVWPVYTVLCGILVFRLLRHMTGIPGSNIPCTDDLLRRARGTLRSVSHGVLFGSLALWALSVTTGIVVWVLFAHYISHIINTGHFHRFEKETLAIAHAVLMLFNLLFYAMTTLGILLLGRSIIFFEIFTGRMLPRQDLRRQWRHTVVLACSIAGLLALSIALAVPQIYILELLLLLGSGYFAVSAWRAYQAQQRQVTQLRPFFRDGNLFDALMAPAVPMESRRDDHVGVFREMCTGVLQTDVGLLIAAGTRAPFIPAPITCPPGLAAPEDIGAILARCRPTPAPTCFPLDPPCANGAHWAVPLWKGEQLIGLLLLGGKRNQELYLQEEIDLAVACCERLLDLLAGTRKAQQLIGALRRKIADQQVLDLRPRRVLHDDIANQLIQLLRYVNSASPDSPELKSAVMEQLQAILAEVGDLLAAMPKGLPTDIASLGLVGALRVLVEDDFEDDFDEITWQVDPRAEAFARGLPSALAEVFYHATREIIRNAMKYARGGDANRPLHLKLSIAWRDGLQVVVEDDGVGMRATEHTANGTGQGMSMHSAMVALYGGSLTPETRPDQYTRITLYLPEAAVQGTMAAV